MKIIRTAIGLGFVFLIGCQSNVENQTSLPELHGTAQAISLLGDTLYVPQLPEEVLNRRQVQRDEAEARAMENPDEIDALIWVGRRTAYLGRYRESIDVYTKALERFPEDPGLYRHRGHRFITIRRFKRAVEDLQTAANLIEGSEDVVEPDGMPNARNIPTSTLHFNIWYHLGLAHYLLGDFENALKAYRACMDVSENLDAVVATSHWLYMTLRRMDRAEQAESVLDRIVPEMDIIENGSYHQLLLMYKGLLSIDDLEGEKQDTLENATVGYGIANWYLYNGKKELAVQKLKQIISGSQWAAFGTIAAEAELVRWE